MKKFNYSLTTRYKLSVSYDGSKFYGSQIQNDKPTVAGRLSEALEKVLGVSPRVLFASRTDRGVHARENVCSFSEALKMPEDAFVRAVNARLGGYIKINKLMKTGDSFNPRHGCLSKTYRYYVRTAGVFPYMRDYVFSVSSELDRKKMEKAASLLAGKKDFRRLSSCSNRENTMCDIINCRLSKGKSEFFIETEGSHFLYKMVRTAAAFVIACGKGKVKPEDISAILDGKLNRIAPAPACGLYLWRVEYAVS
ncbi:MAG: tRNA pseudouridine(38-40) synthase TruA [Elusimicrobiota bacterium]|nr:tRNA pseudouridine(38-40) synthase TruA [Elusimicrobiota bacterium]